MALDYFAPGVYVEEVDRGSRPIEGVSLSIAGFIGFTEDVRGDAELFQAMMITNWSQYLEYFAKPGSDGFPEWKITAKEDNSDQPASENGNKLKDGTYYPYLPFAIKGWFDNGGGRCWVTSIGTKMPGSPKPPSEDVATKLLTPGGKPTLMFNLKPPQAEGEQPALPSVSGPIAVVIENSDPKEAGSDAEPPINDGQYFKLTIKAGDEVLEPPADEPDKYSHLTMDPEVEENEGTYVLTALADSQYVTVTDKTKFEESEQLLFDARPLSKRPANGTYEVASAPHISEEKNLTRDVTGNRKERTGMQGLFEVDEVAMIAFPDLMLAYQAELLDLDQVHGVMEMMLSYCENSFPGPPYRMTVLDPPPVKIGQNDDKAVLPEQYKPQYVDKWLTAFNRRSMFGALYYPWIKVANPVDEGRPLLVPPCGHMMGIWCRTDQERGVFKAPANDTPRGVIGLAYDTNMREQELLNPKGINCIRNFASYNRGYKVWGARTLVEPDNIPWRYISVRRLLSYIEKSIEMGTQWVVFEPNDQDLWARVTRTVSNFLEGLWRAGALFGASPAQAFFVKCDESLNPEVERMKGRLYIEVGVAPVRPAEFVIFRIGQMTENQ